MTDLNLDDADRLADQCEKLATVFNHKGVANELRVAAALLRKIPELQQKLKEQQEWARLRHNTLEGQLRDQVDKRVELHRRLIEATGGPR